MSDGPVPMGFGPVLAQARAVPESQRALSLVATVAMSAAIALYGIFRGVEWPWSIGSAAVMCVLICVANFNKVMRAGDGWFAKNNCFVRTDRLIYLRARFNITSGTFVSMKDSDGRFVDVRLSDLTDDAKIWQLFAAGLRESFSRGLIVNHKFTACVFRLPRHLRSARHADTKDLGQTDDLDVKEKSVSAVLNE